MIADLPLDAAIDLNDVYRYAVYAENGNVFAGVSGDTMRDIFENRMAAGRLIFHRNREKEVDGLLIWYRLKKGWTMEQIYNFEPDDEDGGEILIKAAFSETPFARRWGIRAFLLKEPDSLWCDIKAHRKKGGRSKIVDVPKRTLARLLKDGQRT
jgi:hypothetical protein